MLLFLAGENYSAVARPLIPIHRINVQGGYNHSAISCHALISMNLVDLLDGEQAEPAMRISRVPVELDNGTVWTAILSTPLS